jgi:branched-chain amino acid transport system permease protein
MAIIQLVLQSLVSGILTGGVYALLAVGFTLIFGVIKIPNFAQCSFMMIGMYITFWCVKLLGMNPYLSLLLSIPVLFLLGYLVEHYIINHILGAIHLMQVLLTWGILLIIENGANFLWGVRSRTVEVALAKPTLSLGLVNLPVLRLIAFVAAFCFAILLYLALKKTDIGKAIRAAADDRTSAQLMGVDVRKIYNICFGIGCACAGAAGSLIIPFFHVNPYIGDVFLLTLFIVVILGGVGSFFGAFFGGIVIGIAESFGVTFIPGGTTGQIIPFIIFILVVLFKPSGMFGAKSQ